MNRRPITWDEIDNFDFSCPFCKDKDEKGCEYCKDGELSPISLYSAWIVGNDKMDKADYDEKRKEIIKRCNCILAYNRLDGKYYIFARDLSVDGRYKFFCYGDDTLFLYNRQDDTKTDNPTPEKVFVPELALAMFICTGTVPVKLAIRVDPEYKGSISEEDHTIVIRESIKTLETLISSLVKRIRDLQNRLKTVSKD